MQFWIDIKDDSELDKLYQIISIGLTNNIVGPFLDPKNALDITELIKKYPKVKFWDNSIREKDAFTTLEVLAAKHAFNQNLGFILNEDYVVKINWLLIKEAMSIIGNKNLIIKFGGSHRPDISQFDYLNLLNLDLFALMFMATNNGLHHDETRIEYRNYYAKQTRLGYDMVDLKIDSVGRKTFAAPENGFWTHFKPDFLLTGLERYDI